MGVFERSQPCKAMWNVFYRCSAVIINIFIYLFILHLCIFIFQRCLVVVKIVDGGRTCVTQAGRSHPDVRGSGMYRYLQDVAGPPLIVARWPGLRRSRSMSVHTAYWDRRRGVQVLLTRVSDT